MWLKKHAEDTEAAERVQIIRKYFDVLWRAYITPGQILGNIQTLLASPAINKIKAEPIDESMLAKFQESIALIEQIRSRIQPAQ